jgi:glycosyltransferase involved in cell wall biosynthesis
VKLERFEGRKDKAALKARLGLDPARPVVVYSGSWDQWKGVETLVDAFAHLANSKSGAILLLIGLPDSIAAAFKAKLSAMGIAEDRVILHGHLPRRELARWLCAADVGVVPNNDTLLSAHYTSPLKVFEYLAAGLAVVASDVPALRAVLGDRETVFARAGDALDMAEKLGRLLQSHVDCQDRQSAARQRAINFDYAVRAERILAIYYNLSGQAKVR